MNIAQVKTLIRGEMLKLYDSGEADAIASAYMEDKLGITISDKAEINLPEFFFTDIRELGSGRPLQYVTGIQHFSGTTFKVNESVLIPRPETEELVSWILSDLNKNKKPLRLIDIGTGSGCIPVILKKRYEAADVYACDISEEALRVAGENADKHDVKITFFAEDILNPSAPIKEGFDIIVSNPPYIPLSDLPLMDKNVTGFEPHTALFAPTNNPVIFYNAIADYAAINLKLNGTIYFELNPDFTDVIVELMRTKGFSEIEVRKDLSNRQRFLRATFKSSND